VLSRRINALPTGVSPEAGGARHSISCRRSDQPYIVQPQPMGDLASKVAYGPTRTSALKYVDPKVLPYLPTTPEHMQTGISSNEEWWADHYEEVNERFQHWLAQ
jgi:hypothetical protein